MIAEFGLNHSTHFTGFHSKSRIFKRFYHLPPAKVSQIPTLGSAIFRSPIGAAFFAIEVLYSRMEFESGALLYTMLASIVAYGINGFFVGWQPLFYVSAGQIALQPTDYL